MCMVNPLGRQLWVRKTVAPCQGNKANVNKPDTLEILRKMSCYSSPSIICHMTPPLNLLLHKKERQAVGFHEIWMEAKQHSRKESGEGTAFTSCLCRRKRLPTARPPGVSTRPAWGQDPTPGPGAYPKTQPRVIINGNRKLEKTVTSYTNTTVICLSCCALYSSFYSDPVFSFTLPPTSTGLPVQISASDPIPGKCRDYHHTEFHNKISTMTVTHSPSALFT